MAALGALQQLEPIAGALLIVFILIDFFFTVLYARVASGIVSVRVAHWTWIFFKFFGRRCGRLRSRVLSFCGPLILVLLVIIWGFGLTLGTALIVHPSLGHAVVATDGQTTTDFGTAMYVGASSLAIVGASDFAPKSSLFHWLFFVNSLVGMAVLFLTTTYVLQVYTALQNRNAFALKLYVATKLRGDAAELVAGLGPAGRFEIGYASLSEAAGELAHVRESHHFYPVVFYFRFSEAFYSVSAFTLTLFDTVSLLKSALDEDDSGWLAQSGAVNQLWDGSMLLVTTLSEAFIPGGRMENAAPPSAEQIKQWTTRYESAVERLRRGGIAPAKDLAAGVQRYLSLRADWDPRVTRLAAFGAYSAEEIDPISAPKSS